MAIPCSKGQFLTISEIQALLRQAGWAESLIPMMSAIVIYESSGCPLATNKVGEYSIGLLQMNMRAHGTKYGTEQQLYNPLFNLQQALKLSKVQKISSAWYNSYRKWQANKDGIARQADAVYNQLFSKTPTTNSSQSQSVAVAAPINPKKDGGGDETIYFILGLIALSLLV